MTSSEELRLILHAGPPRYLSSCPPFHMRQHELSPRISVRRLPRQVCRTRSRPATVVALPEASGHALLRQCSQTAVFLSFSRPRRALTSRVNPDDAHLRGAYAFIRKVIQLPNDIAIACLLLEGIRAYPCLNFYRRSISTEPHVSSSSIGFARTNPWSDPTHFLSLSLPPQKWPNSPCSF